MELSVRVAWYSLLTNLVLVGIKSALVALSGSLAVTADAMESLTDVASSALILTGIKLSQRSSRRFPYGLYKVENLVSLATSLLILYVGFEIVRVALQGDAKPPPSSIPLTAAGIVLTIVIKGTFFRYELRKGRETASPSLMADARHIGADLLSSVLVLTSLVAGALGWAVDRYAALVVVLFVAWAALGILVGSVRVLLDASLDPESLGRIREIALADPRVVEINELRARNAGRFKFVELDLTLRVKNLDKGHQVSEELKQRIRAKLENVDHVQVHYQPVLGDCHTVGVPLCEDRKTVSEHFGEAPFFRLITLDHGHRRRTRDATLPNPYVAEQKAKGIKVARWLLEQGLDRLVVCRDLSGKGPGFVFGDAEVEVLVVPERDAEKALTLDLAKQEGSSGDSRKPRASDSGTPSTKTPSG